MVSVQTFAQKLMQDLFGSEDSPNYRACVEALPYVCALIRSWLRLSRNMANEMPIDELRERCIQESVATWGQKVYPKPLETQTPEKYGILDLICVPGALLWR